MGVLEADRTTADLVAYLARIGLRITANQIRIDTHNGYLPSPRLRSRGPSRGVVGLWEPWAVRRATYLYRLRRRGARGDVLRVLLFLRDGWGWSRVAPLCQVGLSKLLAATVSVRRRRHRRPIDLASLDFTADDTDAKMSSTDRAIDRFISGTLLVGEPLEGGSMRALLQRFGGGVEVAGTHPDLAVAEHLLATVGLTIDRMEAVTQAVTEEQGQEARACFAFMRSGIRNTIRRLMRDQAQEDARHISTNPLTFFGIPPELIDRFLHEYPGRPTRAQVLAASVLAPSLLMHHLTGTGEIKDEKGVGAG